MNEKQLYSVSIPQEHLEFILDGFRIIDARKSKLVLAGSRIVRERRGPFVGAHFIRDRRRDQTRSLLYRWTFIFILLTLSIGTWAFTLHVPAHIGAPVMATHLASLTGLLLFKPYNTKTQLARS